MGVGIQDVSGQDVFFRNNKGRVLFPHFRNGNSNKSISLSSLPGSISHPSSELSLIPDFDQADKDRVPVYLINASDKSFRLEIVALELPVVLEAHLGGDHWERAEPQNGHGRLTTKKKDFLSAGHFRVKKARFWSEGEPALLRYALYQEGKATKTSAPFHGKLPIGEIDKARHDVMSAMLVPEPLRIRYVADQVTPEIVSGEWFTKIELLRTFGPCYADLDEAQQWIAFVHESPMSHRRERDLAIRLQLELLKPWPSRYNLTRLHERCVSVLFGEETESTLLRPLCWQIVSDYAGQNPSVSSLDYPKLAKFGWDLLFEDRRELEKEAATDFLCVNFIAKNFSPVREVSDSIEDLLEHEVSHVRLTAANWILTNQKNGREKLVLAYYREHLETTGARELVRVLHFDRQFNPYARPDWALWATALDKDVEFTFPKLSEMFESDNSPTRLRKFSQTTVLPKEIRSRLETYYSNTPQGPKRQSVKRLLDNVNAEPNRILPGGMIRF